MSQLSGKVAEVLLANDFRTRNRFTPSVYFQGVPQNLDQELIIQEVKTRVLFQCDDGKTFEFDIQVEAEEKTFLLVEVKKQKRKIGKLEIEKFCQKIHAFQKIQPDLLLIPGFVALGGFTQEAEEYCKEKGIGTATQISFFNQDWSF